MAIVPAGSGNGLARALKVARDPRQAILEAVAATPRSIDAGTIDGHLFFSLAGVGFDAHVALCFDREKVGGRGLAGYVRIVARELVRYKCAEYRIDGADASTTALLVTIAPGAGEERHFTATSGGARGAELLAAWDALPESA